ncbi:MAG: hypothetical protein HQM08_25135 [Candidatus Riflebacteria bacterium]|nr:hypothetical protein [Candidatus Riflebacteria bacterium]
MFLSLPQTAITDLKPVQAIVETQERRSKAYSISLNNDTEWRSFLWKLQKPEGLFEEEQIRAIINLWDFLNQQFSFPLPLPLTQPTVNGNIQLAWDAGRFYLEIEVRKDCKLEWFFRDRDTNQLDGTEDEPESTVSQPLFERLVYVVLN